jgi:sterol carrier protein 2
MLYTTEATCYSHDNVDTFLSYSQFQEDYTMEQIMNSPCIYGPLTKLQCCPTSDGSAAAILATEDFVRAHGLEGQAVEILGIEMATDLPSTFNDHSCMKIVSSANLIIVKV